MNHNKTRQIIEIDVTWTGWRTLLLKRVLIQLLAATDFEIERLSVREVKKK